MFQDPRSFGASVPVDRDALSKGEVKPVGSPTPLDKPVVAQASPVNTEAGSKQRIDPAVLAKLAAQTAALAKLVAKSEARLKRPINPDTNPTPPVIPAALSNPAPAPKAQPNPSPVPKAPPNDPVRPAQVARPQAKPELTSKPKVTPVVLPALPINNPAVAASLALLKDWAFIWHRKALIAACIAASLFLCVIAELALSPRYRAASQILIGPLDLRGVEKAVTPTAQTADASVIQVESETRVLTSDKVLRRVVESERLTDDPEFQARGTSLSGTIISTLRTAVGLRSDQPRTSESDLAALRQLQRNITAKRTERTYVVDLIVETSDPEKSARIANAVATAYLAEQSAARNEAARRVTDSLSSRLSELRERVRNAEEQVERYKSEHSIVGASGRLVDEQQLTDLNNQLSAAKARTAEAKSRYDQMSQLQRNGSDAGSTTEGVQSNTIGRLREQYATIARQEANLASELGPRHPWVIEARAQVRNAQQLITEEIGRIADANRNDYQRALTNENALAQNLDSLKRKAMETSLAFVKLRELEREVDASRAVYESFLGRARETREQESLDTANVRILSEAQPSPDRSWPPRRLYLLLVALLFGILGGVGLAYVAELFSRKPHQVGRTALPMA